VTSRIFNVYLGPYDSWGWSRVRHQRGTAPEPRRSQTKRQLVHGAGVFRLAPVPGTLHALTFSNANYSQGNYGTSTRQPITVPRIWHGRARGSSRSSRWGEGSSIRRAAARKTLEAITPVDGTPPGCAAGSQRLGADRPFLRRAATGRQTRRPICCRRLVASTVPPVSSMFSLGHAVRVRRDPQSTGFQ